MNSGASQKIIERALTADDWEKIRLASLCLEKAREFPENYENAVRILSAVQHDSTGYVDLQLGLLHGLGRGTEKDEAKAQIHFRRAVLRGKRSALMYCAIYWMEDPKMLKLGSAKTVFRAAMKDTRLKLSRRVLMISYFLESWVKSAIFRRRSPGG